MEFNEWLKCRRCHGRGMVANFIMIDEDEYFEEEELCEFCDATGQVTSARLAQYEASLPQPINGEDRLEEDILF